MQFIKIVPIIVLLAFSGCEQPTAEIKKSAANVDNINGLYIYIKSRPMKAHKVYDRPINRNAAREIVDSGNKRGVLEVIGGLAKGVAENVSFQQQVHAMTVLTKEMYPEADGVIFSNSLNECAAFEFEGD